MRAWTRENYGNTDVLELVEDHKVPTPKKNQVLIKMHACSLNLSDYEILIGKPLYARLFGLWKPRLKILGSDVAGTVEKLGENSTKFKVGDAVFGDIMSLSFQGGFAEYVCAPESCLTLKPDYLTFEQAAAIPQAANIAYQVRRENFSFSISEILG